MKNPQLGHTLAFLLLRIWLGMRAIQSGVEKFAGNSYADQSIKIDGTSNSYGLTESVVSKTYALSHYSGVPTALAEKLSNEPLLPTWMLSVYNIALGPLLIIAGLCVILGLAIRTSLFTLGLIFTSLTFGLILIKQDAGIAWLGTHVVLVVLALQLAEHNRFAITKKY